MLHSKNSNRAKSVGISLDQRILTINPQADQNIDDFLRRSCCFKIVQGTEVLANETLFFDIPTHLKAPASIDCDSYLIALLMDGMMNADLIRVKGSVSKKLLSNLTDYQSIWKSWSPDTMKPIQIEVEQVVSNLKKAEGVAAAFSGGLDAVFTLWRHHKKEAGWQSKPPTVAVLLHGMDIPLDNEKFFKLVFASCSKTTQSVGIPLVPIRTNFREVTKAPWEFSHGLGLVASLSQLKHQAGDLLLGSSEPYDALVSPWGSHPMTDVLLSAEDFEVNHDGAAYSRSMKTKIINQWPESTANLRVCWIKNGSELNCNKCEKCLRSNMNFLSNGAKIPKSLQHAESLVARIKQVKLKGAVPINEWETILQMAKKNRVRASWVNAAKHKLAIAKYTMRRKAVKNKIKAKLGLK